MGVRNSDSKLVEFIQENKSLFWSVSQEYLNNISIEALVETILNNGNEKNIKILFDILGLERISSIFHKQISQKRNNYKKRTINFFNLYFDRHAHGSSK